MAGTFLEGTLPGKSTFCGCLDVVHLGWLVDYPCPPPASKRCGALVLCATLTSPRTPTSPLRDRKPYSPELQSSPPLNRLHENILERVLDPFLQFALDMVT